MSNTCSMIYLWTEDGLRLSGVHYEPSAVKDLCLVMVHGMAGTIINDYFNDVLGRTLYNNGIGFLFGHNRGHSQVNDTITNRTDASGMYIRKRIGMTYERFSDCLIDIDAWLKQALVIGYKSIVIMGHSLGCPKTVYYFLKKKPRSIAGIILASPADTVGLAKKYEPNYESLLIEAKTNVANGQPEKILSKAIWDSCELCSQTFLDLFEDHCPADVLPLLRNPHTFPELTSIDVPMLVFYGTGERSEMAIRSLEEDLNLMESKATGCPTFTQKLIPDATHWYDRCEDRLAETILGWVKSLQARF